MERPFPGETYEAAPISHNEALGQRYDKGQDMGSQAIGNTHAFSRQEAYNPATNPEQMAVIVEYCKNIGDLIDSYRKEVSNSDGGYTRGDFGLGA